MDVRRAINDFVYECKNLGIRLRSKEQESITEVDLVMLRAELFLLDTAAANLQELKRLQQKPIEPVEKLPDAA